MKIIILAGGKGTRLAPITHTIPKPLIPIGEKNLTEHVFDILKKHGFSDVILSVGHMKEKIKEYFISQNKYGMNITFLEEKNPMGTAGPLMLLKESGNIPKEDFIMLNGDCLFSLDLHKMHEFHKSHKGVATIALYEVDDPSAYGVVELDGSRIRKFVEKPNIQDAPSRLINSGYYMFRPEIFDYISLKDFSMMEHDIFPHLASKGILHGFKGEGQWFDTGTHERYNQVRWEWRGIK